MRDERRSRVSPRRRHLPRELGDPISRELAARSEERQERLLVDRRRRRHHVPLAQHDATSPVGRLEREHAGPPSGDRRGQHARGVGRTQHRRRGDHRDRRQGGRVGDRNGGERARQPHDGRRERGDLARLHFAPGAQPGRGRPGRSRVRPSVRLRRRGEGAARHPLCCRMRRLRRPCPRRRALSPRGHLPRPGRVPLVARPESEVGRNDVLLFVVDRLVERRENVLREDRLDLLLRRGEHRLVRELAADSLLGLHEQRLELPRQRRLRPRLAHRLRRKLHRRAHQRHRRARRRSGTGAGAQIRRAHARRRKGRRLCRGRRTRRRERGRRRGRPRRGGSRRR